ncbi:hypothetical protein C1H46_040285 [Malus baccata]|uniref:Uncharacterized protein n=1 Tax=Malus baccata TaxID=106549 RepID=A0A540KIX7_MALBA|nr:hypothetical protein C1H46_040285 [Malus baccata]
MAFYEDPDVRSFEFGGRIGFTEESMMGCDLGKYTMQIPNSNPNLVLPEKMVVFIRFFSVGMYRRDMRRMTSFQTSSW